MLQQGSARNCGRAKTRYVPLRGYRDAMQWGQVGLEGPWQRRTCSRVSAVLSAPVLGVSAGTAELGGLDLWSLPRLLWAATLGMEAPLFWLLFNNTRGPTRAAELA